MKLKNIRIFKPTLAACLILGAALTMQSCKDDLLTGQPSWLGESIYQQLQADGNYTITLRLIDDLGLHDVMNETGSRTLFVADDATFQTWFASNSWGAKNYESLSTSQKKLLLNNAMINNAYLIELLSNVSADPPETGLCMRRPTASSVFDSIFVMKPSEMNGNLPAWSYYAKNKKSIILFKDGQVMSNGVTSNLSAPMIHFLPAFMSKMKMTSEDLSILTNGAASSTSEAWINGKKVTERDITCKNGYIQKVDGVIEANNNMAEILRQHNETSLWSKLIDRFSAPYYDKYKTQQYNRTHTTQVDSVFTLRYFCDSRKDGMGNLYYPETAGNPIPDKVDATLTFDPGWNQYMYENTSGYDMHYDAGAMLVPTNEALDSWWNNDGKVLKDMYGTWDNVPDKVLSKLLNVNMMGSFTETVPSKFSNIVNDAKVSMGVTKDNVVRCYIGCNGVIYEVNKVFSPSAYSSVSFPALINQNAMSVIYWAIDDLEFTPYLNSMDTRYSLVLPTNNAMLWYVDPCTYGENQETVLRFYYDSKEKTVSAERYACTIDNSGNITLGTKISSSVSSTIIENRLKDVVNQMIIVGNVEDGHTYYKSKNGTTLKVENAGVKGKMIINGAWQTEHNSSQHVDSIYDMSKSGNGKSYSMSGQIPMSSTKSVYETLKADPDHYSKFLELLSFSDSRNTKLDLLASSMTLSGTTYSCAHSKTNNNITLFGAYNYTVYVPTNEAIQKMEDDGYLPTPTDFDNYLKIAEDESKTEAERAAATTICNTIRDRIFDFVRYHIQDNSVTVGGVPSTDTDGSYLLTNNYESMMLNTDTRRYYPLTVKIANDGNEANQVVTITDRLGNTRNIVKTKGLYNNICREYWILGNSTTTKTLYTASDAIVHQIDGVLLYSSEQNTKWKTEVSKAIKRIARRK